VSESGTVRVYVDRRALDLHGNVTTAETLVVLSGRHSLAVGGYYVIQDEPGVPYWQRKEWRGNDVLTLRGGERFWIVPSACW
jgi:hypothetical protein